MACGCKAVNWTAPVYGDSNGARESASSLPRRQAGKARQICERISPPPLE
jgi:hypothetical protein